MKRLIIAAAITAASLSTLVALPTAALAAEPAAAAPVADPYEVSNDQMVKYYTDGLIGKSVYVVDSRPAQKFNAGHIPGSVLLPLDVLKKDTPAAIEKLGFPKDGKVIFYCAGRECTLSVDSADIFRKAGYTDALVYRNGIPGWNQKGQPLLADVSFVNAGNVILIDTGFGKKTIVAPGVQTMQIKQFELGGKGVELLAGISRNASIVVLDRGDMKATNDALDELRDQEFRRLAYLPLAAWTGKLANAPALAKVVWTPVYGPGQISPKDFETAVARGEYILDIRPEKDFARGHFKGSINIPIENFDRDHGLIPRDRTVFVHCTTGAKSLKAFEILGRKGFTDLKYLDAEVECKGEVCTIKE